MLSFWDGMTLVSKLAPFIFQWPLPPHVVHLKMTKNPLFSCFPPEYQYVEKRDKLFYRYSCFQPPHSTRMANLWRSYQTLMTKYPWTVQIVTAGRNNQPHAHASTHANTFLVSLNFIFFFIFCPKKPANCYFQIW